jgi:hypothetical protein
MTDSLPYRDFYYPLNVFMHILTLEEVDVRYLHYGLFESDHDDIGAAQERSTELLLAHLPPAPARVLEVGVGLGTTLARLVRAGYQAEGLTPDLGQIEMLRARHGERLRVQQARFEDFTTEGDYHAVFFQESSQYIDSKALFERARELTSCVVVLDEFALREARFPGALHNLDEFLMAAAEAGFSIGEQIDVSAKAAPTIDYFLQRLPRFRETLIRDLSLTDQQVDELIDSGKRYRDLYATGTYGYRLLRLERGVRITPA